jgi:enoyl-CoA hydratase/carnithine racemase
VAPDLAAREPAVLPSLDEGILTLAWYAPSRRNAWSVELEEEYFDALERACGDPQVRVIVVTGTGPYFCPGLDVGRLEAKARGVPPPPRRRPITFPLSVGKPVIAAINGTAAGLGLVQALLADVRFAAAGTRLSTSFARRGLVAEHLASWLLPRMIGHARATDLLLSGRIFTAQEAADMGLVKAVVPAGDLLRETRGYARELAERCSPLAMAQIKNQLLDDWTATREQSLARFSQLKDDPRRPGELAEGVASFVERRLPRFDPLSGDERRGG